MRIILTGGGSAGHVQPNMALLPALLARGHQVSYIGAKGGIEAEIVQAAGIPFYAISAGKLRRYLSVKNIGDAFRVIKGLGASLKIIKKVRPDVIFSKGGFVTVPVVFAAKLRKVPVIIHESDFTVGLANRLAMPHAARVCCIFPETAAAVAAGKGECVGPIIRREILEGSRIKGAAMCGFAEQKPVVLVFGGSLGSVTINECLREALDALLEKYNIVHIVGKNNIDSNRLTKKGYVQFEYISEGMGDLYALADLAVSRAGAGAIFELLALNIPNILIPLSKKASRGDQILNAQSFEKQGFSLVIQEEDLTPEVLQERINELFAQRGKYAELMKQSKTKDAAARIVELIEGMEVRDKR